LFSGGGGFALEQFAGLGVPVGDEQRVDARDHGTLEARHVVLPLQPPTVVAPPLVADLDDVL
jgi:hypothetical protein